MINRGIIDPGLLTTRADLQRQHPAPDAYGHPIGYQTIAAIWVSIIPLSARESTADSSSKSIITHEILTNYRDDIDVDAAKRLEANNRTYEIVSIIEIGGDKRGWKLEATELSE